MPLSSLKPHSHAERTAIIERLVPLWQEKFGENLLGIGACASYARGEDTAYSDLELDLFLKELPAGEDAYYQRVVDGMLIEVIYKTPEHYLMERGGIAPHWYISASDRYIPVYNAPFIEKLTEQGQAAQHPEEEFWQAAARERYELQESFGKVLNAVEQDNVEGASLLVMDAALHLLKTLAFVNEKPFTTFSRFIGQGRQLATKPEGFDAFLDILVQGAYRDLPGLRKAALAVMAGVEQLFAGRGMVLFNDPFDPRQPNTPPAARGHLHFEPVDAGNFKTCIELPTGADHRHVAPNIKSIAQAQFIPGAKSCCIVAGKEIVGYILYRLEYDDKDYHPLMWISRLMMSEAERGKGYGREALKLVIEETRQLGCTEVGLSTHLDNFKAIGLYESLGFQATEMSGNEMVYRLSIRAATEQP